MDMIQEILDRKSKEVVDGLAAQVEAFLESCVASGYCTVEQAHRGDFVLVKSDGALDHGLHILAPASAVNSRMTLEEMRDRYPHCYISVPLTDGGRVVGIVIG